MKDWIDIIKERLQEAQAQLPPNDWEEFEASCLSAKRPRVLPWLVPALAVAAAAALFVILKPGEESVTVPEQPLAAIDRLELDTPVMVAEVVPSVATPIRIVRKPTAVPAIPSQDYTEESVPQGAQEYSAENQDLPVEEQTEIPETKESVTPQEPVIPSSSPFVPNQSVAKRVNMKMAPAAGAIVGGGLLAALVAPVLGRNQLGTNESGHPDLAFNGVGYSLFNGGYNYLGTLDILSSNSNNHSSDLLVGDPKHYFPLKTGLSVWLPVAERLYVTTGLDYSWYPSTFTYSFFGEQKQQVHYLGIPIRLDWVIACGKHFDAYVGGGLEGEFCLGAFLGGKKISKDGPKLSLVGVGGFQMNLTRRLGLYVEPQVSWCVPTGDSMLSTYRSSHPLMFSVATGLRINLGNQFSE